MSAGTADESVAEECRVIADYMGCYTFKLPDVSVDGLHRILHNLPGLLLTLFCRAYDSVNNAVLCMYASSCQIAAFTVSRLLKWTSQAVYHFACGVLAVALAALLKS